MNSTNQTSPNMGVYELFESKIRDGFKSLIVQAESITASIKYSNLPKFDKPVEELELEVIFPGAVCLINFGQSEVEPDLFFSRVKFERLGQPTLFLKHYLSNRKDQRQVFMRFSDTELSLEQGISRIVDVLVAIFNDELRPLLEGLAWFTAPFDWGDYK